MRDARRAAAKEEGAGRMQEEGSGGRAVILDGIPAGTVAIKRVLPGSVYAFLPDRFYAYVDSKGDRVALTKSGREVAAMYVGARGGRGSKRRPALLGELARMRDAGGEGGGGPWLGRIEAVYRAAAADPRSKAAERWVDALKYSVPESVYGQEYPDDEAFEAAVFKWLYTRAEEARLAAAEAAEAAEKAGGEGAVLVTIRPDLLAFAGDLEKATGGRLRILDAQIACPEATAEERAERAARLRRILPRAGERLAMAELRRRFGLLMLGRFGRSVKNHVIVIVRERGDEKTYEKDGLVMCAGEGRHIQRMDRINRAIRDSGPEGYPILLFERAGGGGDDVVFKTCLRYRSHSILENRSMYDPCPEETILFALEPVDCGQAGAAA